MSLKKHLLTTAALSALAILALTGCIAGAESASTPEPTSTATPVPIESIAIDPQADPEGFIAALPPTEAQCAASAVGGADVLVKLTADPADSSIEVSDTQLQVMAACFSDKTIKSVMVGQLELQAGGLTDETRSCIAEHAAGVDLSLIFSEGAADAGAFVSLAQSLFCLNGEERIALEASAGSLIDTEAFGGIDALECVVDSAGIETFTNIATTFADGPEAAAAMDFSAMSDFLPAMIECGVLTDEDLPDTGMTTDQMSCLFEELDAEALASIMTIAETPDATADFSGLTAALGAFEECGVDLEAIVEANTATGPGSGGNPSLNGIDITDVPSVSVDAVICLTDHGVSLEIAAAYAAGLTSASADATLAAAIEECEGESGEGEPGATGTPQPSLIGMLPVTEEQAQCLLDTVGTDQLQGIAEGTVSPLTILTALETCDISIEELLEVVS